MVTSYLDVLVVDRMQELIDPRSPDPRATNTCAAPQVEENIVGDAQTKPHESMLKPLEERISHVPVRSC